MQRRFLFRAFQVLLGVTLGLLMVFFWFRGQSTEMALETPDTQYFLPTPVQMAEFALPASLGRLVSTREFLGKVLVVSFGYTSCPDVCPMTLTRLTQAFREIEEVGERVQVLLVTVDPRRDTPERLDEYLENFHPSFIGLTGEVGEIRSVADAFGVYFSDPPDEPNYTIDHTARTFVLDRYGRLVLSFPVTATAHEMATEIQTLIEISGG